MQYDNLISRAKSLKESEKFQDALNLYKEALSINPNSPECYFGIASCYSDLNLESDNDDEIISNYNETISNYKKGLSIEPTRDYFYQISIPVWCD